MEWQAFLAAFGICYVIQSTPPFTKWLSNSFYAGLISGLMVYGIFYLMGFVIGNLVVWTLAAGAFCALASSVVFYFIEGEDEDLEDEVEWSGEGNVNAFRIFQENQEWYVDFLDCTFKGEEVGEAFIITRAKVLEEYIPIVRETLEIILEEVSSDVIPHVLTVPDSDDIQ